MFRLFHLLSATMALALAANSVFALPSPASAPSDLVSRQAVSECQPVHASFDCNSKRSLTKRASVCNGDASLCDRLYSNVTYIGAHDSYAVGTLQGAVTGHNQEQTVTTQLNDGIRLLQVQAHKSSNSTSGSGIDLCHSSCSLEYGGTLESYLSKVESWLSSNPNEVVTLLIVNSDDQPVSSFGTAFSSTNLSSKAYTPSSASVSKNSWPTLGSMIDSGKNLVVFIDNSADTSSVSYILPHFSNTWENAYDQTSTPFNCTVDRINSGSSSSSLMYLINHYLDSSYTLFGTNVLVPNTAEIDTTNSYASIMQDADNCASMHANSYPTFVLTDFYDMGNGSVFQAAAKMNGVQYTAKAIGNATKSGETSKSSSSSGSQSITMVSVGNVIMAIGGLAFASALL
ncbi:uncharacterized protein MEPE_04581 [Melanopsichium pennsylvanicum]|uniref:PLC-like phosphodiesterase n=2 Tax=Melanopsichium pennsylvanicum TaxID=63383 RepID=A0AAJ4XQ66_9BASI|nr:plc-like phosphodiesterase [Melanopsichium pennsylvanicum 4]SNX85872.1 uncharacterized protein MEPE_04581 [Melanopsichium pennsylvanicum]